MRASAKATDYQTRTDEDGFVLIGVLFLVVVVLIMLAIAAPKVATSIKRDKELELYHRGMQYTRAIKLYYKKFGHYPTTLDQLENTNNIRFLRKKYNDPFTGKPDWRLIHVGEAKVAPTGLFGQPLGVAGAGNTTGNNGQSGFGSNTNGSSFGNNTGSSFGNTGGGSGFGSGNGSSFGNSFSNNSAGSNGQNGSPTNPSNGAGTNGTGMNGTGTNGQSGSGFGSSSTGGPAGLGNSTLTSTNGSPIGSAGPIIGVASISAKESIREYEKQKHYNEWEFVYNPQTDLGGLGGNTGMGVAGQNGLTNNPFGSGNCGNSASTFGGSSSFGSSSGSSFGSSSGSSFGSSSSGSGSGTNSGSGCGTSSGSSTGNNSNSNNGNSGSNGNSGTNGNSGNGNPPTNPPPAPPVQMDPPSQ